MYKNKPVYLAKELLLHLGLVMVMDALLFCLSHLFLYTMGYAFFIGILASAGSLGICFYYLTTYHQLVYTAINFAVNTTVTCFVFDYLLRHPINTDNTINGIVMVLFMTTAIGVVVKLILDRLLESAGAVRQNGNRLSKALHLTL